MPQETNPNSQTNLRQSRKPPEERGVYPCRVAAKLKARLVAEARRRGVTSRELLELLIADACPPLAELTIKA